MIPYENIELSPDVLQKIQNLRDDIDQFREQGPLDQIATAKLEEHFRASHVYNSAGIEGNRLTLQETLVVLNEGIDVSGKPLKDSIEVKNLARAFDFLKELSSQTTDIREQDIRDLHSIIVGDDKKVSPGEYRKTGVIISGAEHRPPQPIEVPARMQELVAWINAHVSDDPIILSALAHHELVKIHPFLDGNGRVSRLLMNLILMKRGYPICNIKRTDRPKYYESLSFADVGMFEMLIELVISNCSELFAEYLRIRQESVRMQAWAEKWGQRESENLLRRATREFELWESRIRQVKLEFQKAAELLDERIERYDISFYEYPSISFEKFQNLCEKGSDSGTHSFSIQFSDAAKSHSFMFHLFRNWSKYERESRVIPLELNYYDVLKGKFTIISEFAWSERIKLRAFYFTEDGELHVRLHDPNHEGGESETTKLRVTDMVQGFFDNVLSNFLNV